MRGLELRLTSEKHHHRLNCENHLGGRRGPAQFLYGIQSLGDFLNVYMTISIPAEVFLFITFRFGGRAV